jgi:hypothetical protein
MNSETGQFIRIQIPARVRVLWLSPAWAVVCGIIASRAFVWIGHDILVAALALVIADGAWATVWWGLIETDWRQLFAQWKTLDVEGAEFGLASRDSPADRSQHGLARWRMWWRVSGREQAGTPILSVLFSVALTLLLSVVIGWPALALSLAALALIQIALILRLAGRSVSWLQGLIDIGLAWLLGHAAFGSLTWLSALAALLFSFAYAAMLDLARNASSLRRWLIPQVGLAIVLVLLQQPMAALIFIAVLVAQALLATVMRGHSFARAAQYWLMLAMLIVALGIAP